MVALKLPRLDNGIRIVKDNFTPSLPYHQWWQNVVDAVESAFNQIDAAVTQIEEVLELAGLLETAVEEAQAAADAAQEAADTAQDTGEGAERIASLANSGVTGLTMTATDAGASATINIGAHTRLYGNGDSVVVNAGTVTGLAYSTSYYVYYIDAGRAGGAVTYLATTSETTAAQTGDTHLVGRVVTPAAAAADTPGDVTRPPGIGNLP